jgi:hypothetical protein
MCAIKKQISKQGKRGLRFPFKKETTISLRVNKKLIGMIENDLGLNPQLILDQACDKFLRQVDDKTLISLIRDGE